MKDWALIERLNLYVDDELSPAERRQLEVEVQADPGKLKLFNEYVRMDAASQVLFESFRRETAAPRLAGNVIWFPRTVRPREQARATRWQAAGAVFAAACVAAVVVPFTLRESGAPGGSGLAATPPAVTAGPVARLETDPVAQLNATLASDALAVPAVRFVHLAPTAPGGAISLSSGMMPVVFGPAPAIDLRGNVISQGWMPSTPAARAAPVRGQVVSFEFAR